MAEENTHAIPEVIPPDKPTRQPARSVGNVQPGAVEIQESLLECAGYDREKRAEILKESIETQREALVAEETKFGMHLGEVISKTAVIDHNIRLKAARDLQDVVGDGKPGRDGGRGAGVAIQVNILPFAQPNEQAPKESNT